MQKTTRISLLALPAAMAVALAACGGGGEGDDGAEGMTEEDKRVKYNECLRDNGIDIQDSEGGTGAVTLDEGDMEAFDEAKEACEEFEPEPAEGAPQSDEEAYQQMLAYAECMRENGVDDFEDPEPGGAMKAMPQEMMEDPTFQAAMEACEKVFEG
ncbi:hypothetical protein [Salininema proteolyticum]|uniref:Uncharacterized protein n=1 Tax=Salininema proteolyticum TaxID=1607685 RepID=A0ABV8U4H4_9ACTN